MLGLLGRLTSYYMPFVWLMQMLPFHWSFVVEPLNTSYMHATMHSFSLLVLTNVNINYIQ
jgi:hypothetical protein